MCGGRPGENCSCFFQAEDGIRDLTVTGVQTCALPIFFKRIRTVFLKPHFRLCVRESVCPRIKFFVNFRYFFAMPTGVHVLKAEIYVFKYTTPQGDEESRRGKNKPTHLRSVYFLTTSSFVAFLYGVVVVEFRDSPSATFRSFFAFSIAALKSACALSN